jgi:Family of unknown function (DUF5760)
MNMEPTNMTDSEELLAFKRAVRALATVRDEKSELATRLAALNKVEKQHMRVVLPYMQKNGLTEVKLQHPYCGRIVLEEKQGLKGLTRDHVASMAREVVDEDRAEKLASRIFEARKPTTRHVIQRLRDE